ncbi:MAG: HAMP domain-containing histidine kinase [Lachnospiraceae bacterium]|nr:HAMP domain-containing histidine kinase [Lachnospiraceae bacterium]
MKRKKRKLLSINFYFSMIVITEIIISLIVASLSLMAVEKIFNIHINVPPMFEMIIYILLICIIVVSVVNDKFFGPIKELNVAMEKVAQGDFSIRLEEKSWIDEVKEIYSNFNSMVKELGATEIIQTDFVSNVSHEIKTPINAIEGYVMLLQDSQCSEAEKEQYIERILFNTKRLSELVSNVLLLSKLDNQTLETNATEFRLDEQIRQAIMGFEPQWTQKNIDFDIDMDEIKYRGNEKLLIHIWTNLIGNAIKFSPDNGKISIGLKSNDKNIAFTIQDEGPGIGKDAIKHIFDKFYQEDSSHKQEGSGLGLALVKRILNICEGNIEIESELGKGSKFIVEIAKNQSEG